MVGFDGSELDDVRDGYDPEEDEPHIDEGTCVVCGAAIHYEESDWFHTRIDDSSHPAFPKGGENEPR